MAGKLRVEYGGGIYSVLNRGDRCAPIFQTDRDRAPFPDIRTESCRKIGWQGDAQKLKPTPRLRRVTTMTWQGIANRLHTGAVGSLANLVPGAERKQEYAIMLDPFMTRLRPSFDARSSSGSSGSFDGLSFTKSCQNTSKLAVALARAN